MTTADPHPIRRRTSRASVLAAACLALLGAALLVGGLVHAQARGGVAHSIELDGTVDPATERWLDAALDDAEEAGAELMIVRLDTPGGLDSSMRSMVQRILSAELPVVVYVAPQGARAASAGLFVTLAADVAAMAPGTNIGAATPVQIGGGEQDEVLGRKVRNDAAAYVRALAEGRDRNPDLAERMVRDAVSVSASRALERNLVDFVAPDERALLDEIDGFRVAGPGGEVLDTAGLRIERRDTPFQYELMQLLVNPTIASLLLVVGLIGLAIEIFSPGGIAPGVLGAIALVLGLYGTAQLPVTAAGVLLLALALGLIAAETQVASGGILGIGGVVALVAGLLLLYDTDSEVYSVSVPAAIAAGVLLGAFTLLALSKALAARGAPVHGGAEEIVGSRGEVRAPLDPVGQVFVHGSLWRARSADEDAAIGRGERVRVSGVDGLTLTVRPDDSDDDRQDHERSTQ